MDKLKSFESKKNLIKHAEKVEVILIFYCEFSSERGPKMYNFVRNHDRSVNKYPHLFYPQTYVMEGGFSKFHENFRFFCKTNEHKRPKQFLEETLVNSKKGQIEIFEIDSSAKKQRPQVSEANEGDYKEKKQKKKRDKRRKEHRERKEPRAEKKRKKHKKEAKERPREKPKKTHRRNTEKTRPHPQIEKKQRTTKAQAYPRPIMNPIMINNYNIYHPPMYNSFYVPNNQMHPANFIHNTPLLNFNSNPKGLPEWMGVNNTRHQINQFQQIQMIQNIQRKAAMAHGKSNGAKLKPTRPLKKSKKKKARVQAEESKIKKRENKPNPKKIPITKPQRHSRPAKVKERKSKKKKEKKESKKKEKKHRRDPKHQEQNTQKAGRLDPEKVEKINTSETFQFKEKNLSKVNFQKQLEEQSLHSLVKKKSRRGDKSSERYRRMDDPKYQQEYSQEKVRSRMFWRKIQEKAIKKKNMRSMSIK